MLSPVRCRTREDCSNPCKYWPRVEVTDNRAIKSWTIEAQVDFCLNFQGSAPPLSPSSTSPVPPFSAGPYGPPAATISPQPPTAPVHHHLGGSQDISEEHIWKDFPPLKLPPGHCHKTLLFVADVTNIERIL